MGLFVSNEEKIYAYLEHLDTYKEKVNYASAERDNSTSNAVVPQRKLQYHTIRSGESVGLIANKYNVSVANLRSWNHIKGNNIQAGKKLKIYSDKNVVAKTTSKTSGGGSYTVRSGDSLYSIAKQFPGISAEDIKKWNDISGDNIQPGMKLKING